jgi:hypothetical protein
MNRIFDLCMTSVTIFAALLAMTAAQGADRLRDVEFANCTEFVGVAPVAEASARALVPARFHLVADAAGARLLIRIADCEGVRVGTSARRPGRIAQIGIVIASPDGTAIDPNTSINNYTLSYATNVPALARLLREADVPAVLDPDMAYEFAPAHGPSELYAATTPGLSASPTWFIHGSVTNPAIATTFLANWWFAKGDGETKMATTFPVILFDFTSTVSFYTSRGNVIGHLIGSNKIANFPLSFRGAYEVAHMIVSEKPER